VEGTPQDLKEILPKQGAQLIFQNENSAEKAMELLLANGIAVDSIQRSLPSLEDVFLTLVDEKKEDNVHA